MKKSYIGYLAIIFGSLILSIELYGLKIIHIAERPYIYIQTPFQYLLDSSIGIAVFITLLIIVIGIVLIYREAKKT